jgi:osmotically-inducible protein OsmY
MSTRYGDRGFGRYGDSDEDRTEDRNYDERDAGRDYGDAGRDYGDAGRDYGRGSDYGPARRGGGYASSRGGDYDYGRDHGYGRDYDSRDYFAREYGSRHGSREHGSGDYPPRYGREGLAGGYAGSRRYGAEDYGRDYAPRAYARDAARDYERARTRPVRDDEVRDYDTDYGRTTSRFYGRSGYEYGREEDYDRDDDRDERRVYARRGYAGRDERGGGSWLDRAADQVRSWFGGDDDDRDERRREVRGRGEGRFRGRGPRNYRRSDERVREEVCDHLTDNEWLDASEVEVNVVAGEVILAGTVDSRYAKRLAESIAESVTGVANVQNNLRVHQYQTAEAVAPPAAATTPALTSDVTAVTPGTNAVLDPEPGDTPPAGRSSSRAAGGS